MGPSGYYATNADYTGDTTQTGIVTYTGTENNGYQPVPVAVAAVVPAVVPAMICTRITRGAQVQASGPRGKGPRVVLHTEVSSDVQRGARGSLTAPLCHGPASFGGHAMATRRRGTGTCGTAGSRPEFSSRLDDLIVQDGRAKCPRTVSGLERSCGGTARLILENPLKHVGPYTAARAAWLSEGCGAVDRGETADYAQAHGRHQTRRDRCSTGMNRTVGCHGTQSGVEGGMADSLMVMRSCNRRGGGLSPVLFARHERESTTSRKEVPVGFIYAPIVSIRMR